MKFKARTLNQLGELVVGNTPADETEYFPYRSSTYITEFFADIVTDYEHNGSTRHRWVADIIGTILDEPQPGPNMPPDTFSRLISRLMDPTEAINEGRDRPQALAKLNAVLAREGFEAFYAEDRNCYLRHVPSNTINSDGPDAYNRVASSVCSSVIVLPSHGDPSVSRYLEQSALAPSVFTTQ